MTNPETYTTITELHASIAEAIEASGAASGDEFDLDAIADQIAEYDGRAFIVTADTDAFWDAVQAHFIGAVEPVALAGVEDDALRIITTESGAALHSETLGCWIPATDNRAAGGSLTTPGDWRDPSVQCSSSAEAAALAADPGFWARLGGHVQTTAVTE